MYHDLLSMIYMYITLAIYNGNKDKTKTAWLMMNWAHLMPQEPPPMWLTMNNNKAFFKLPKIVLTDCTKIAVRWEKWLKDTEQQFMYFGTAINAIKKDRLIYGGPAIADLLGSDIYWILIAKQESKKNKYFGWFQFGNPWVENSRVTSFYFDVFLSSK